MSKKDKPTSELALPTTSVFEGIEAVNKQIEKLKHISDSVYKTNGKVPGFSTNLQNETNVSELIKMYSSVAGREAAYNSAALELLGSEATYPVFKLEGATSLDYKADIRLRIDIINNKTRLDELTAIKKEYTELMDKQDRMKLLAKKLEKFTSQ